VALALGGLGLTGWVATEVTSGVGVTSADDAVHRGSVDAWPIPGSPRASRSTDGTVDSPVVLGYGEIDRQHQRAVDLLGLLEEALRTDDHHRQVVALTDVVAWVRVHFAFEEALMDSYQLPDMTEHKTHHHAFLAQVSTLAARFEAGTAPLTSNVLGTLRNWITRHVAGDDVALVAALTVRGVPSVI
jgi:hemerythrin